MPAICGGIDMIYLNNAATSWPKPDCVRKAFSGHMDAPPCGQLRSSDAEKTGDILGQCRRSLGRLLGVGDWQRIFFTSGATEAANLFIQGMDWEGFHAIVSQTEHNSILRPIWNHPLPEEKITILPCDGKGYVSAADIRNATPKRAVVFINHCSNVTGTLQPMEEISAAAKKKGYLLAVDVSQSAGCIPVEGDKWQADVLIVTGHKGLSGPQGTGGIYIRPGLDIKPLKYGGTGKDSDRLVYQAGEYEYEPGTQNAAGIAALGAGVEYILDIGVKKIHESEQRKISWLLQELGRIEGIKLYGPGMEEDRGPLAGFTMEGLSASELAYILTQGYGIIVRSGLQCAPLMHSALGTDPAGLVRVSISYATKMEELETLVNVLKEISGNLVR